MAQDNAERSPTGRTALGGAACGFTYDAALQDAVAREGRLRRPLKLKQWQDEARGLPPRARTVRDQPESAGAAAPTTTN